MNSSDDNLEPSDDDQQQQQSPPKADVPKVQLKRRNQQYNRRKWRKMQEIAKKWTDMQGSAVSAFLVMRLNKGCLEWGGPDFMGEFANDPNVQAKFKETALSRQMSFVSHKASPKKAEASHVLNSSQELSSHALRRAIAVICNKKKKCGFWQDEANKPCWWPEEVPFKSPNWVPAGVQKLRVVQLALIYDAFKKAHNKTDQHNTTNHPTPTNSNPTTVPSPHAAIISDVKNENYRAALDRLSMASWNELHDMCSSLLPILPPPMPYPDINASELPPSCKIDQIRTVLPRTPSNFVALNSTGDGNCLFHSLSLLLMATEESSLLLRLAATVYGVCHWSHYVSMYLEECDDVHSSCAFMHMMTSGVRGRSNPACTPEDIIAFTIQKEAAATAKIGSYSGILQVLFVAGYLNVYIQQHCQDLAPGYDTLINSCPCRDQDSLPVLHLMWVKCNVSGPMNHFVPLIPQHRQSRRRHRKGKALGKDAMVKDFDFCVGYVNAMCQADEQHLDTWIQCGTCHAWYHCRCAGIAVGVANSVEYECCSLNCMTRAVKVGGVMLTMGDLNRLRQMDDISGECLDLGLRQITCTNGTNTCALPYFVGQVLQPDSWLQHLPPKDLQQRMKEHVRTIGVTPATINSKDIVLIPVCISNHWIGLIIDKNNDMLVVIDSLRGFLGVDVYQQLHKLTIKYIQLLSSCTGNSSNELKLDVHIPQVPQQDNNLDCGLFVLASMEAFLKGGLQQMTGDISINGVTMRRRLLAIAHDVGLTAL